MKLTAKHIETLEGAARHPLGYVERRGTNNGLGSASRRRMLNRLALIGFLQENAHGEYEITPSGRYELQSRKDRRDWEASHERARDCGY